MNPSDFIPAGPDIAALASTVFPEISALIESARHLVVATANLELVSLYWNISRIIDRGEEPYLLNFLGLEGSYSEKDLETGIIQNLQKFGSTYPIVACC